ncbi:MAG TPA: hypothetical protein VGR01_06725 [Burkholderiales bacterium]|nr:hypothetical protein [Burkholderiales bacterium]
MVTTPDLASCSQTCGVDTGTVATGTPVQTILRSVLIATAWLCWVVPFASAQQGLNFSFDSVARFDAAGNHKALWMKGEVAEGDLDRLLRFLREHPRDFVEHGGRVVFVVDGGDVVEATRLGRFLGDALIEVWLPDASRTRCVSACFFMFVNAVSRIAVADSLGFHRPYFDAERLEGADAEPVRRRYESLMRQVRDSLDQLLVPRELTEKMLGTPWNETYWFSREDLDRLGETQAWFEDFSAAKCGVEPRLKQRLESAIAAGFEAEAEALRTEFAGATKCVAELRKRQRQQLIEKLTIDSKNG